MNTCPHGYDASDGPPRECDECDLEFEIASKLRDLRAKREALRRLNAEDAKDINFSTAWTLADNLAEPEPDIKWAVHDLAVEGSIVTLPSSRKTGKTTLLANLAKAGVDDRLFLGQFSCGLGNRTIANINCEMTKHEFLFSYRPLNIRNADRIYPLHCREQGIKLNFLDAATVEKFGNWLVEINAGWMYLDPWKDLCAWAKVGMNDTDGVNQLTSAIRDVHAAANLGLTLIPMHVTQNPQEAGAERGKGAGELEDGADALWRYTRSTPNPTAPRVLAVEGRGGAGLEETAVNFNTWTHELTLGEGDRQGVTDKQLATKAFEAVRQYVASHEGMFPNTSKAKAAIGGHAEKAREALDLAEARGLLKSVQAGNQLVWKPNESSDSNRFQTIP
jgi:hypothetical protein